ncbi:MAG: ACP S-malonyltransferase [Chloroflexi bacterium]|nr:ACP S-malonyltransferase [Chloroflexota bacterium]
MENSKIALVFPGQGSQYVGMGKDLYETFTPARRIFDQADECLGFALSRLCFEGPEDELRETINSQPAIFTTSLAILTTLREQLDQLGKRLVPTVLAGHSLGEYTALVAAGSLSFEDGLQLVRERGRLMKESGDRHPGGMAAVIGLDDEEISTVCQQASAKGIIIPANFNSPGQVVISGEIAALTEAMQLALTMGARRAVRLAISIASHSPLMQQVSDQLGEALNRFNISEAQIPVIANISARAITSVEDIRNELVNQVSRSVLWAQTVLNMGESGVDTFVEVGPGQALTGLIKRVRKDVQAFSVSDAEGIAALLQRL